MVPPMPAFYNHPQCVGDIIDHVAMRVLDQFGIEAPVDTPRWSGLPHPHRPEVWRWPTRPSSPGCPSRPPDDGRSPPVHTTARPCTRLRCARPTALCTSGRTVHRASPASRRARHDDHHDGSTRCSPRPCTVVGMPGHLHRPRARRERRARGDLPVPGSALPAAPAADRGGRGVVRRGAARRPGAAGGRRRHGRRAGQARHRGGQRRTASRGAAAGSARSSTRGATSASSPSRGASTGPTSASSSTSPSPRTWWPGCGPWCGSTRRPRTRADGARQRQAGGRPRRSCPSARPARSRR